MPVFGTIASKFNDDGVTALYQAILGTLAERDLVDWDSGLLSAPTKTSTDRDLIVPAERTRYLAEIAETVRDYHHHTDEQALLARERQQLSAAAAMVEIAGGDIADLDRLAGEKEAALDEELIRLLAEWPEVKKAYSGKEYVYRVRGREIRTPLTTTTICGNELPRVALPDYEDDGELLRWRRRENLPGHFPFTAGVFPFKRQGEDPTRMFAGEGDPFRTNKRFKLLSKHSEAKRLSTAFDSVTLYGNDPDLRPDIYGKVGNSGVSIATLDDMRATYDGFDLCDPSTSVSMTINGPAPTIMAMFLNTAIDQQLDKFAKEKGSPPKKAEAAKIRKWVHENVRGTVQADILKEDQGQNTCLFSTEFSLKVMGDIQALFRWARRAEFLFRFDLRLSHRRGGSEPDQPTRLYAGKRFHIRGGVSCPRDERRRLRTQSVVLPIGRHGSRIYRPRPRRAAHMGVGDA